MAPGDGDATPARGRPPRASAAAKGKAVIAGTSSTSTVAAGTGIAKGSGFTRASSSGTMAAGRSTMTDTAIELVDQNGKTVKISGSIECVWSHGEKYRNVGFSCGYCGLQIAGGGATRFRQHLGSISGDVGSCGVVPLIVKDVMANQDTKKQIRTKQNKERRLRVERDVMLANLGYRTSSAAIPPDEEARIEMAMRNSLRDLAASGSGAAAGSSGAVASGSGSGSGAASCSANHQTTLEKFYSSPPSASNAPFDVDLARSKIQAQPRVDIMLAAGAKDQLGKAWAKFFHANDIPGRKADCPYFRSAVKFTQQLGQGVHIPNGREIDGPLLDINYEDMKAHMAEFKEDWDEYGVTIMCDSWTGPTMMSIINFMIYCNGRMFFHKSVNATGEIQNSEFIYKLLEEVIVEEVGVTRVVQIVTDNGANYKKACQDFIACHPHIYWQPCAAHTINLMLKDIASYPFVAEIVDSAKRICRFLYRHNRVHAMMKEKIDGELIRWNATRFGTVFIFLQSFWDRQEKFKKWMVSDDWESCKGADEDDHEYTYVCMTSKQWWRDVDLVLRAVQPIYSVLRFADQQKSSTISGFLPKIMGAIDEISAKLTDRREQHLHDKVQAVISKRLDYLLNDTLMVAAAALDPLVLYTSKLSRNSKAKHAVTLALKKIARSPAKASAAIDEYAIFRKQGKMFGGEEGRRSALSGRLSAADWWDQYGGEFPNLQEFARRIVSQCLSSSGCERNWSTFALVHTKLRNRLHYEKLHKLVYVHYNLKLRIQQFEADMKTIQELQKYEERESDPCSIMMDVAMYDERNPIMDWLCNSWSESVPSLDECDDCEPEIPDPSRFLIDELEMTQAQVAEFKKLNLDKKRSKKRKIEFDEEDSAEDYESDSVQASPKYAESGDSSSNDGGDDDDGGPCGDGTRTSGREECTDGGAKGDPPAPSPLRPRSKRLKQKSVKCLY